MRLRRFQAVYGEKKSIAEGETFTFHFSLLSLICTPVKTNQSAASKNQLV